MAVSACCDSRPSFQATAEMPSTVSNTRRRSTFQRDGFPPPGAYPQLGHAPPPSDTSSPHSRHFTFRRRTSAAESRNGVGSPTAVGREELHPQLGQRSAFVLIRRPQSGHARRLIGFSSDRDPAGRIGGPDPPRSLRYMKHAVVWSRTNSSQAVDHRLGCALSRAVGSSDVFSRALSSAG